MTKKSPRSNMMRVAAGEAKGRLLIGAVSPEVRPTTARVRAAIFNILQSELYQDGRVLDLYAGTGSLGIEALSQGARWADFVDQGRRQCAVIQANLNTTGFGDRASVRTGAVPQTLSELEGPYQLVLLDPPYKLEGLDKVLEEVASTPNLVDDKGMVVVGHSRHSELRAEYGALHRVSQRRYGDNAVDFYCNEVEPE